MGGREKCKQISCNFIMGEIMMKNITTLQVLNQNQAMRIWWHPKKTHKKQSKKTCKQYSEPKKCKKKIFFNYYTFQ